MMDLYDIYHRNLDFLWVPLSLPLLHRQHWIMGPLFIAACLLTLRTQVELVEYTGFNMGFLPWFHSPAYVRGMAIYNVVIVIYLALARYSPNTKGIIFFAASLTIYVLAFCASMVAMAL
jgi:hypothetical protein